MKKKLSYFLMSALLIVSLVGCGAKQETSTEDVNKEPAKEEALITVDKEKKEVKIVAEVNGKYFTEPTRHGVVFKDGSNGEKSVLRGLVSEKEIYQAIMDLGATPGNNLVKDDLGKGKKIEGSKMNVFVTWEGSEKEIPFSDIIKSSEERPMDIRFGGNIDRANKFNTGCILCLDSCAVGITSNAAYAFGESDNIQFYGNQEVLPKDGTKVTVIFRLAE